MVYVFAGFSPLGRLRVDRGERLPEDFRHTLPKALHLEQEEIARLVDRTRLLERISENRIERNSPESRAAEGKPRTNSAAIRLAAHSRFLHWLPRMLTRT